MTSVDVEKCYASALGIAKRAGVVIAEGFKKTKQVELKTSPRDLVTETDTAVEKMVIGELRATYPDHMFIGEESVAAGAPCELTNAPTWIIDPVDGTLNFVHSFPHTCISIALWEDKQPLLGVVFNPILDHLYTAKKGQGAFLNGEPIKVSAVKDLSRALVTTELGFRPTEWKMNIVHSNAKKIIERAHGVRCLGSATLHMCQVAAGGADVALSLGLFSWDKAAATLLVQEAGGTVLNNTGEPHDLMSRGILCASSPELAAQVAGLIEVYQEDRD